MAGSNTRQHHSYSPPISPLDVSFHPPLDPCIPPHPFHGPPYDDLNQQGRSKPPQMFQPMNHNRKKPHAHTHPHAHLYPHTNIEALLILAARIPLPQTAGCIESFHPSLVRVLIDPLLQLLELEEPHCQANKVNDGGQEEARRETRDHREAGEGRPNRYDARRPSRVIEGETVC